MKLCVSGEALRKDSGEGAMTAMTSKNAFDPRPLIEFQRGRAE